MEQDQVRPEDQARGARMVLAHVLEDRQMFEQAVTDLVEEVNASGDYSAIGNLIWVLSGDVAKVMVATGGKELAIVTARQMLLQHGG